MTAFRNRRLRAAPREREVTPMRDRPPDPKRKTRRSTTHGGAHIE